MNSDGVQGRMEYRGWDGVQGRQGETVWFEEDTVKHIELVFSNSVDAGVDVNKYLLDSGATRSCFRSFDVQFESCHIS